MNENSIQISEDAILNALDASEVSSLDLDFSKSITIEIGSTERAQFDNCLSLGKFEKHRNNECLIVLDLF